jgi:lipid-A-disaccharide synthase
LSSVIYIATGEESGDLVGGELARAIKKLKPSLVIRAMGGSHLAEAGAELEVDISGGGIVGLLELASAVPRYWKMLGRMKMALKRDRPAALVAIDNFGFNHLLCRFAHRLSIPVFYYSPPKVWAWGAFRGRMLAHYARMVYTLFPFEADFFRLLGVQALCFGHPLAEKLAPRLTKESNLVAILPGSRRMEVENLLPDMLAGAELLKERHPSLRFVLGRARTIDREYIAGFLTRSDVEVEIVDDVHNLLSRAYLAMLASGTATLESALLATPMVIVYRARPLTALLARLIAHKFVFGLPNYLAGRMIVPELLQNRLNPSTLAYQLEMLLTDRQKWLSMQEELVKAVAPLRKGAGSSSERVAGDILRNLQLS